MPEAVGNSDKQQIWLPNLFRNLLADFKLSRPGSAKVQRQRGDGTQTHKHTNYLVGKNWNLHGDKERAITIG